MKNVSRDTNSESFNFGQKKINKYEVLYSICHKKFEIDTTNFLNVTKHIRPVVTVSINSQKS